MKRLISIILCICLLIVPFSVYAEDSQADLNTTEQTETTAEIKTDDQVTLEPIIEPEEEWRRLALEKIREKHGDTVSPMAQASGLVNGGIYNIRNLDSGKYLNVHYGVDANGTNVYQWTYDGSTEQKFKLVYSSSTDSYKLYAMCSSNGSNRVIDIARNGSPLGSGQNVEIWTPIDNTAQQLQIEYLIHNYYVMRMKANTSMFIAVNGTSNGTGSGTSSTSAGNVYIDTYDVFRSQEWVFELISHPTAAEPTGTLESVNSNGVSGWAWRSDDLSIKVGIRIYITNNSTGEQTTFITTADKYRSDLASSYANHGFSLEINWGAFSAGTYTVNAYAVNATGSLVQLSGSPKTYTISGSQTKGSLKLNTSYSTTLGSGTTHIYTFTPPQTDYYNIFTTSSIDTYGMLYYNGSQVTYNDDSGDGNNFKIQYKLDKDVTYYIHIRGYNTSTNGSYTVRVESAFLDKLDELHNLAKNYTSVSNSFELTMQYIRKYAYNGTFWTMVGGTIDNNFVEYVNSNNSDLAEYFTMPRNTYWYAPNGDVIDIPHLAATYNVYSYDSYGLIGTIPVLEEHINRMGGWAGDLRSLVPYILRDTNYTSDYNTLYNKTIEYVGSHDYFSQEDLLADVDALNIWNIVQKSNSNSFKTIFTQYYLNGGTYTRFTDFVGDDSNYDFYSIAMSIMRDSLITSAWELMNEYNDVENINVSIVQYDAICQAFTDYIWERKEAENA